MTFPTVPFFARHLCVDSQSLKDVAGQRVLPPTLEQRRDSQGQFVSHREIPETKLKNQ